MLDFGWAELLLIAAILVLVVGPKELPPIMRALGRIVRRLQYARYAISRQFDDLIKDADLDDLQRSAAGKTEGDEVAEAEADEDYFAAAPLPDKPQKKAIAPRQFKQPQTDDDGTDKPD